MNDSTIAKRLIDLTAEINKLKRDFDEFVSEFLYQDTDDGKEEVSDERP